MPLLAGGSLKSVFPKTKRQPEKLAQFYIAQIIIGIGKLHERGILHRDLKMSNVMLDTNGYIKIIDFGLAIELLSPDDLAQTFCGTTCYIAPEILAGQGYDKMVDWWSVGIILYEMLFGFTPFLDTTKNKIY